MQNSECATLAETYRVKRERDGLVDAKFYVANAKEAVHETVCGEVNRLDEAVARGDVFVLDFDDRHE